MPRVSVKRSRKAGVVNEPLSGRSDSRPSRSFDDAAADGEEDGVVEDYQSGEEEAAEAVSEPEINGADGEPNGSNGDSTPSTLKNRKPVSSVRASDIDRRIQEYKEELATARRKVTLFRAPFTTLRHFIAVVVDWLQGVAVYLMTHQTLLFTTTLLISLFLGLSWTPGAHETHLAWLEAQVYFIVWWVGLGIASAIGLGTGLHTFVLYTMPYIIEVGTTAVECGTLNFAAEGPNAFECPPEPYERQEITFFGVYRKVAAACFLWGAGTAIGELPPYFVARAARLTGQKLEELEEIQQNDAPPNFMESMKHKIFDALQNYGFIAIMLFASVPNPLFDLCGLTCGHFLVPFWTFFGATVIGKAVNKVTGQAWFVIYIVLNNQDALKNLHESSKKQGNWLSHLWDLFIMVVVGIFLLSIITASVQERLATLDQQKLQDFKEKLRPSAGPGSARRVKLLAE